jgi:hypothetical protein
LLIVYAEQASELNTDVLEGLEKFTEACFLGLSAILIVLACLYLVTRVIPLPAEKRCFHFAMFGLGLSSSICWFVAPFYWTFGVENISKLFAALHYF